MCDIGTVMKDLEPQYLGSRQRNDNSKHSKVGKGIRKTAVSEASRGVPRVVGGGIIQVYKAQIPGTP